MQKYQPFVGININSLWAQISTVWQHNSQSFECRSINLLSPQISNVWEHTYQPPDGTPVILIQRVIYQRRQ